MFDVAFRDHDNGRQGFAGTFPPPRVLSSGDAIYFERRRWDFPLDSQTLTWLMRTVQSTKRGVACLPTPFRQSGRFLFQLLFPGECEICGTELKEVSRVPVCAGCLKKPYSQPAEFACITCGTPFLNDFPLRPDGR